MSFEKKRLRRTLLPLGPLLGFNLACASLTHLPTDANAPTQPNIVFILLDDLDQKVTEPYFEKVLPFTMSLKSEGVYFTNAFAPTPLCCPARATILTGKYAHNTGVLSNRGEHGGYHAFKAKGNENQTITVALKNHGYRTAAFGKYLNGYAENNVPQVPKGWSAWHVFAAGSYYTGYNYSLLEFGQGLRTPVMTPYSAKEQDYSTDVLSKKARAFVSEQAALTKKVPFFLYLTPTAPHSPLSSAPRHQSLQKKWAHTLPINRANYFSDGDTVLDKPFWLRTGWNLRQSYKDQMQDQWMKRLGSLYAVDEMIRDLVQLLKEKKLWDNTLFVVTSDNGLCLGSHSLIGKKVPYEESIRVPLVIASGKNLNIKKGIVDSHYVLLTDHGPTFLDLAHVPPSLSLMDGRSLLPLLKETAKDIAWREDFLVEFGGDRLRESNDHRSEAFIDNGDLLNSEAQNRDLLIPSYRGIRGRIAFDQEKPSSLHEFTYIEWADPRVRDANGNVKKEYELYNLDDDPDQLNNLLYNEPKKYLGLLTRVRQRLATLTTCVGESCR